MGGEMGPMGPMGPIFAALLVIFSDVVICF